MKLYDVIVKQGEEANRIAVIDGDHKYTYLDLHIQSEVLSQSIRNYIGSGKNIGLYFKRSAAYLVSYFAVLLSKNKIVPLDEQLTVYEIDQIIETCDLSMLITDASIIPINLKSRVNLLTVSIAPGKPPKIRLLSEGPCREVDPESDQACILLPSSGTTGKPKRVMHSEQNILMNAIMHIRSLQLSSEDHTLVVLPLGFGYCNTAQLISHLLLGTTIVLYNGIVTPATFFNLCEKQAVACVTVVPTLLRSLVQSNISQKYDLSQLKYIIVGGSKLTEFIINSFKKIFPPTCKLVQTYGLTEAGPRVTTQILDEYMVNFPQCVGKPFPEIKIRIQTIEGRDAIVGEIGEIQVSTPTCMLGYYRNRELTKKVLTDDGYLRTGDLGYLNDQGQLSVIGRIKNLIIKGGRKISPEEIEDILLLHPRVLEAKVYGEICENGEERIHADIVLDKGEKIDLQEIKKHCTSYLSPYKIPQEIHFVSSIERTYNGKIYRGRKE